MTLKMHRN